jgi:hypothetical protein
MTEILAKPEKMPADDKTGYVSAGQEIQDPFTRATPKPPQSPEGGMGEADFINAALKLVEFGIGSYEEAVPVLLIARSSNPAFDYGALKSVVSEPAKQVAESLKRNSALIKELFEHSNERRLVKIASALGAVKEILEDKDGWVAPIATFHNHAIAINSKGDIFRVEFDEANDAIRVIKSEKIAEGHVTKVNLSKTLFDAATALVEGKSHKAKVHLRDLLYATEGNDALEFSKNRFQHVLDSVKQSSFWKKHVRENSAKIKNFLRGELQELNKLTMKPKFRKLTLGEVNEKFVEQYKTPVQKALSELMDRVEYMQKDLQETYTKDQWLVNSLASYDRQFGAQTSNFLNRFVGDLSSSLTSLAENVRPVSSERDIPFQAMVYDTLAEEFPNYALAYLFAKKALSELKSGI